MSNHHGTPPAGALTTVFTPAPSCTAHTDGLYWVSTCMMAGWEAYSTASYFSPGICPSGMRSAAGVPSDYGPPMESTETGMVCCQTGLTVTSLDSATLLFQFPVTEPFVYFCHTEDPALTPSVRWNYAVQVRWAESDLSRLETDPLNPGRPPPTGHTIATTAATTQTKKVPSGTAENGSNVAGATATRTQTEKGFSETAENGSIMTGTSATKTQTEKEFSGTAKNGSNVTETTALTRGVTHIAGPGLNGLSVGAIAGIAVGVAVLVTSLGIGIWLLLRKRQRHERAFGPSQPYMRIKTIHTAPPQPQKPPTLPIEYFTGPAELPTEERSELPDRA